MTYRLNLDTYLIVFRGTDDSIIGWKEDFHMTYMKEIPAQSMLLNTWNISLHNIQNKSNSCWAF